MSSPLIWGNHRSCFTLQLAIVNSSASAFLWVDSGWPGGSLSVLDVGSGGGGGMGSEGGNWGAGGRFCFLPYWLRCAFLASVDLMGLGLQAGMLLGRLNIEGKGSYV